MAAKYKVGLIGAGRAGVPRARAFDKHPLCEIVAITDTDQANRLGLQTLWCTRLLRLGRHA